MQGRVAILLATYQGARFLPAQLDSFVAQTERDWVLYWRDDGSVDETGAIMQSFTAAQDPGRVVQITAPAEWLGPNGSFLALLREAVQDGAPAVAFADQDDVWLPDKLSRALTAIDGEARPTLYCSRQLLVDAELRPLGESAPLLQPPGFPAGLTQNIATGCTLVLNAAAARLVAQSRPPSSTLHDWWSYLVVSAHDGRLIPDPHPTVMYRQHGANMVGAPRSIPRRALAALQRGPDMFMNVLRAHVAALRAQPALLSDGARAALEVMHTGLYGGLRERLAAMRLIGLRRQTWHETMLFRWWFLIG